MFFRRTKEGEAAPEVRSCFVSLHDFSKLSRSPDIRDRRERNAAVTRAKRKNNATITRGQAAASLRRRAARGLEARDSEGVTAWLRRENCPQAGRFALSFALF